jgi:hypothetical protein
MPSDPDEFRACRVANELASILPRLKGAARCIGIMGEAGLMIEEDEIGFLSHALCKLHDELAELRESIASLASEERMRHEARRTVPLKQTEGAP